MGVRFLGVEGKELIPAVRRIVEPMLDHMGRELVHVEFLHEHGGRVLRLYVDKKGPDRINVDELAEVSRDVGTTLDVEDVIAGAYRLEVSSPGLDRPLGKIEDCERFAGKNALVIARAPIDGRKRFKGILRGREGQAVVIEVEDQTTRKIPWTMVKKANLKDEKI